MRNLTETLKVTPLSVPKSVRRDMTRALTSCKAGKIVPVAYVPLLREDRVSRGNYRIRVDMMETVETLLNAINVTAYAHFVPHLAFERFEGSLDLLNRSYKGEPAYEGGPVIPWYESRPYQNGTWKEIHNTLGIHWREGKPINESLVEAYNCLVNYRYKARSNRLPQRDPLWGTLAQCFWKNGAMNNIVPDFDQAMIDGELDLNLVGNAPVRGIGVAATGGTPLGATTQIAETDRPFYEPPDDTVWEGTDSNVFFEHGGDYIPRIYAELANQNIRLTLSNIEMAKKTAAFAKLRQQYAGVDDDALIDMLMEGIRVPDAMLAQPILLDRKSTIIGYSTRHATDSGNLDKKVTVGETLLDLNIRTPAMNTGGIILITLEIVPEQLFERQRDAFLAVNATGSAEDLPQHVRDYADPEKVSIVPKLHVDVEHSDPDGVFGYAPLNYEWQRNIPRIGGKFKRRIGDPFVEDRQRIWSVDTVDPDLTEDFYLVPSLTYDVFADTLADPFEVTTIGGCTIVGNTVFGKGLQESNGDYDAIAEQVDDTRIVQEQ